MKGEEHSKRLIGGFAIAFIGLASLYTGNFVFAGLCLVLFWFATKEFINITKAAGAQPLEILLQALCPICAIAAAISKNALNLWFTLSCVLILITFVARSFYGPKIQGTITDLAASILCLVYIGWLPAHIILLRFIGSTPGFFELEPGLFYTLFTIVSIIINDITSYYAGKAFGRTKLAEAISPNKTIKGSIAGALAGSTTGILMAVYLAPFFNLHFELLNIIVISVVCNIAAQLGDLAESLLKRSAGVKDSGQVIVGHGGVLDRFDSHLLANVLAYYFFVYGHLN